MTRWRRRRSAPLAGFLYPDASVSPSPISDMPCPLRFATPVRRDWPARRYNPSPAYVPDPGTFVTVGGPAVQSHGLRAELNAWGGRTGRMTERSARRRSAAGAQAAAERAPASASKRSLNGWLVASATGA